MAAFLPTDCLYVSHKFIQFTAEQRQGDVESSLGIYLMLKSKSCNSQVYSPSQL